MSPSPSPPPSPVVAIAPAIASRCQSLPSLVSSLHLVRRLSRETEGGTQTEGGREGGTQTEVQGFRKRQTQAEGGREGEREGETQREWGAHCFGMTLAVAVVLVSIATVIGTFRNQQERWSTCHVPQLHHLAGRPSPHRFFPFAMMYLSNHVESKCERAHMQSFHLHSNIVLR